MWWQIYKNMNVQLKQESLPHPCTVPPLEKSAIWSIGSTAMYATLVARYANTTTGTEMKLQRDSDQRKCLETHHTHMASGMVRDGLDTSSITKLRLFQPSYELQCRDKIACE